MVARLCQETNLQQIPTCGEYKKIGVDYNRSPIRHREMASCSQYFFFYPGGTDKQLGLQCDKRFSRELADEEKHRAFGEVSIFDVN